MQVQAKTRNRECSSFATGGIADNREVFLLFGDEGDEKAARGP